MAKLSREQYAELHCVVKSVRIAYPRIFEAEEDMNGKVVYSCQLRFMDDNPELMAARASGVPTIERADLLGLVTSWFDSCICVCGTHGKTTTTALLTQMLMECGMDPSAVVGGKLPAIGGSGRLGSSDIMTCEACEFEDHFLKLHPDIAVILNVDADHMEYFKTMDHVIASYHQFAQMATKAVIYNGEDANACKAVEGVAGKKMLTFGMGENNDYYPKNIVHTDGRHTRYDLYCRGENLGTVLLNVPGDHNILNSISAIAAAKERLQREEERLMARKAASDNSYRNDERPRLVIGQLAKGESFKKAGRRVGLTASEIRTIERELKNRYDLAKLGNGDSFRVLFNSIGTRALINAVEFQGSQGRYAIYRNPQDRGFYSEGEYVPTAGIFRRFPLADNIRISSKFNPHRRHPVTGRVTPHKGVDFRAPVGTPVYAPADGTVTFAGYQRAAGYYIIIRHTNAYSTVYMHLSKMDVRKGDHVYVGEVIARTGNTGRTTGPHLHYEVRVNDRAVDPLKIELPSNSHPQLAREQREAFESNVKVYKTELYTDSLASRKTDSPES